MPVSNDVAEESRTKVSSQINGVTSFPSEARSKAKDEEEQGEREPISPAFRDTVICVILQSQDHKHKDSAGDELGEEHARFRHEGGGVRAEDARGGIRGRWHCADTVTFVGIDGVDVVAVNDACGHETTEDLRNEIHGEAPPWEPAEVAVCEGDGWVQVGTRVAGNVDT